MKVTSQDAAAAKYGTSEATEPPCTSRPVGLFTLLAIPKTERRKRDSG